jgi:hypothetical protein
VPGWSGCQGWCAGPDRDEYGQAEQEQPGRGRFHAVNGIRGAGPGGAASQTDRDRFAAGRARLARGDAAASMIRGISQRGLT